jgi:hypothetical protein
MVKEMLDNKNTKHNPIKKHKINNRLYEIQRENI